MEFVAEQPLAVPQQQAVAQGGGVAVSQAQGSPLCAERQQACHGMGAAACITELLTQQKQPAAFGHDRQACLGGLAQGLQTALTARQLAGVEFRITSG